MTDRSKVISGLERCKLMNKINCDKCPYDYNGRGDGKSECTAELAYDALLLLKETPININVEKLKKERDELVEELNNAIELIHRRNERIAKLLGEREPVEPVKPIHTFSCKSDLGVDGILIVGNCPVCGQTNLNNHDNNYCGKCGRRVTWK